MKILLLVQREAGTHDAVWVIDALDEYTLDEWNGALPDVTKAKIAEDPENIRTLWVEVPNDALLRPFQIPTVNGSIPDSQPEI